MLADGTIREYRYERRVKTARPADGALRGIFNAYTASPEFKALAESSRALKMRYLKMVEDELGWMTLPDLEDKHARSEFYEMRDRFAKTPSSADMMIRVLASVLAWAFDRGVIASNPATRMKRLVGGVSPHADKHFTLEQEKLLLAELPDDLRRLFVMALYTGLRRSDLCALTPGSITLGNWLVVVPRKTVRKTGAPVHLPIAEMPPLADLVAELPKDGQTLLTAHLGGPWTAYNVSHRWRQQMIRLGMPKMRFHDIRHTTATRLVMAGCTEAERGAVMGHAIASGAGAVYTARVRELSVNAYRKWAAAIEAGPVVVKFSRAGRM